MNSEIHITDKVFKNITIDIKVVYDPSFKIRLWIMKLWVKIVKFGFHLLGFNVISDEQVGIGVLYLKSMGKELHE